MDNGYYTNNGTSAGPMPGFDFNNISPIEMAQLIAKQRASQEAIGRDIATNTPRVGALAAGGHQVNTQVNNEGGPISSPKGNSIASENIHGSWPTIFGPQDMGDPQKMIADLLAYQGEYQARGLSGPPGVNMLYTIPNMIRNIQYYLGNPRTAALGGR